MDEKEKSRVSRLLLVASLLFSLAAPQYARVCDAHPNGSMMSIATAIPSFIFAIVGVVAAIGMVVVLIFGKKL